MARMIHPQLMKRKQIKWSGEGTPIIPEIETNKGVPADHKRNNEIVRAVIYDGKTLSAAGKQFGVTRQRVEQLVRKYDPVAYRMKKRVDAARKRMKEALESGPSDIYFCKVCGEEIDPSSYNTAYCSKFHYEIYINHFRYHVDDETWDTHRLSVARWHLNNPQNGGYSHKYIQNVLNDNVNGHGRWLIEGSMAWNYAMQAYRNKWPIFDRFPESIQQQIIKASGGSNAE